jgi:hypothetical protein
LHGFLTPKEVGVLILISIILRENVMSLDTIVLIVIACELGFIYVKLNELIDSKKG